MEPESATSLKISWSQPTENVHSITYYSVNISALPGFDTLMSKKSKNVEKTEAFSTQLKVNSFVFDLSQKYDWPYSFIHISARY